jgi:hypothetical protein
LRYGVCSQPVSHGVDLSRTETNPPSNPLSTDEIGCPEDVRGRRLRRGANRRRRGGRQGPENNYRNQPTCLGQKRGTGIITGTNPHEGPKNNYRNQPTFMSTPTMPTRTEHTPTHKNKNKPSRTSPLIAKTIPHLKSRFLLIAIIANIFSTDHKSKCILIFGPLAGG